MSWACPHEHDGHCAKRHTHCKPAANGCILHGSVVLIEPPNENADASSADADRHSARRTPNTPRPNNSRGSQ